jgi:RNA-directed DNA polymerase
MKYGQIIQSEKMQTCTRLFCTRNLRFSSSPDVYIADRYRDIDWKRCSYSLQEKQAEIVWAYKKEKNLTKIFELQHSLVRSFAARALAVKKVTSNKGKSTPGIDNAIWSTDDDKWSAISSLRDLSRYKAKPVRRVYIPKSDGSLRPLGIPTMFDRTVQTLWYFALSPIAEETADKRSYGFRPYRSPHDCATYLRLVAGSYTATRRYVLDADIKAFFDSVSHEWLLSNIPMDKRILGEFLKAGFISKDFFEETPEGFPQGAVISPTIANMTLDGLEDTLGKEFLLTRYADDFVILGKTKNSLSKEALPAVNEFLKQRGLQLNLNKTKIVSIDEGFEFLGFFFREYPDSNRKKGTKQGIFLVKPSPDKVKKFKKKLSEIVKDHKHKHPTMLIIKLNQVLRGWSEYYRVVTSTKCSNSISKHLFLIIWKMLKTRHRKVPRKTLVKRYFTKVGNLRWVFYGPPLSLPGNEKTIDKVTLFQINYVKMTRHTLCLPLNPYDPENYSYFQKRLARSPIPMAKNKRTFERLFKSQKGLCPVCHIPLMEYDDTSEIHHRVPRAKGGSDKFKNLLLLHKSCHLQVTHTKNPKLLAAFKDSGIIR